MQHAFTRRRLRLTAAAATAAGLVFAAAMSAAPADARTVYAASTPACASSDPADCGALFDDFSYSSSSDANLAKHGWYVRSGAGGPGEENGATWQPSNVTFPTVDGQKSMQLTMSTDGTATGTTDSEVGRTNEDTFAGTYAARIKFADVPVSGTDGDHLVETYYAISTTPDCDPTYSETDFSEYLPNGGYGETRTFDSESTWATTGSNCQDWKESDQYESLAGWHTVMSTVANGHVKYYIDGTLVGDHSGKYYPRRNMSIAFNMWLLDLEGHSGSAKSTWNEDVDWTYYGENRTLTSTQVQSAVSGYRASNSTFVDTVGAAS